MEMNINFIAILVATVANFVLGFIWYTPLFGKAWAKENGFDTNVKPTSGELAKGMIFMVIGNFFILVRVTKVRETNHQVTFFFFLQELSSQCCFCNRILVNGVAIKFFVYESLEFDPDSKDTDFDASFLKYFCRLSFIQ